MRILEKIRGLSNHLAPRDLSPQHDKRRQEGTMRTSLSKIRQREIYTIQGNRIILHYLKGIVKTLKNRNSIWHRSLIKSLLIILTSSLKCRMDKENYQILTPYLLKVYFKPQT
jgi:hypothetical protein